MPRQNTKSSGPLGAQAKVVSSRRALRPFVARVCDENGTLFQHFRWFALLGGHHVEHSRHNALVDELIHRVNYVLTTLQLIVCKAQRSPKTLRALAIARNERVTSSLACSASANDDAMVRIDWPRVLRFPEDWQGFTPQDRGARVVPAPLHQGFGNWVLERVNAYKPGGMVRLGFPADGLICNIDISLPSCVGSAQ